MKHIGFTGTRHGMTDAQLSAVDKLLKAESFDVFAHHGDCKGADAEFHRLALTLGHRPVIHPPTDRTHQAWCTGASFSYAPQSYMIRNRAIVSESDVMLATPAEAAEQERGGTWATIRMARKAGKPLAIVWPDGRVTYERWPNAQ